MILVPLQVPLPHRPRTTQTSAVEPGVIGLLRQQVFHRGVLSHSRTFPGLSGTPSKHIPNTIMHSTNLLPLPFYRRLNPACSPPLPPPKKKIQVSKVHSCNTVPLQMQNALNMSKLQKKGKAKNQCYQLKKRHYFFPAPDVSDVESSPPSRPLEKFKYFLIIFFNPNKNVKISPLQ